MVYARGFHFTDQDTIEYMVGFKMDGHTIKRGTLMQNSYLVPRSELILHMH
jgi:hypothetical protein